ncbi:hypothetical protein H1W37_01185 [Stappia taiwanensis]|uniref:Uncharacterized protein n=1 Tax=Stappia taiwanensis TaxID=992267 RepID=A0A838XNB1_9HYPH|nr:hypothetical protein [Stappia taiwanensis]MBA4610248.1 hypothetical protein [Stappia taiwanensis]GGE78032.1 hypothetical protein GCM10007285_02360 [Stappia taiwanensis]
MAALALVVGACAYAPSGTLVDAFEPAPGTVGAAPATEMRPTATAGAQTTTAERLAETATAAPAPVTDGDASRPETPATAFFTPYNFDSQLLSLEEQEATRRRLLDIAAGRAGASPPAPAQSGAEALRRLGAEHGQRAIRDIEADAEN